MSEARRFHAQGSSRFGVPVQTRARICWVIGLLFLSAAPCGLAGQASSASDDEVRGLLEEGRRLESQGDSLRRAERLESATGGSTGSLVAEEIARYEAAIALYSQAIEAAPTSPEGFRLRAMARTKRDQDANQQMIMGDRGVIGAVASFDPASVVDADSAVSLAPEDARSYLARGKVYELQFMNGWVLFRRSTDLVDVFGADGVAGVLGLEPTFVARAIRDFRRALSLDGSLCEAHQRLGTLIPPARSAREAFSLDLTDEELTPGAMPESCARRQGQKMSVN